MHCNELSLQVSRKLGDLQTAFIDRSFQLICMGFTFCCFLQVDAACIPCWNLCPHEANAFRPLANGFEIIERRFVAHKLSEKNCGTFKCCHRKPSKPP